MRYAKNKKNWRPFLQAHPADRDHFLAEYFNIPKGWEKFLTDADAYDVEEALENGFDAGWLACVSVLIGAELVDPRKVAELFAAAQATRERERIIGEN